jgi:hypothetical protein
MGKSQECEAPDYDFSGEAMRRVISNLKLQKSYPVQGNLGGSFRGLKS